MIDAYEIGIQLLLQEDVSAGLAVITRELAEVDRAIAATSAELAGLVHAGETTPKAVAAAGIGRKADTPTPDETSSAGEQVLPGQPEKEAVAAPVVTSGQKTVAPDMSVSEASVPMARPLPSSPSVDEQAPPLEQTPERPVSSSAPVRSVSDPAVVRSQPANDIPSEPDPPTIAAIAAAPVRVAPPAPTPDEVSPPPVRGAAMSGGEPRRSVTPSSGQVAVTASVRGAQAASPPPQIAQAQQQPRSSPTARVERPAAPGSGVRNIGAQAEKTTSRERAAAPPSVSRPEGSAGGGSVMLEGRLVGQWLSEHMAREASRPPAGTSFFDARQTPAWNVSGAL